MRRARSSLVIITCVLALPSAAFAQRSFTGAPLTYDFAGYGGAGLVSTPSSAQLDSDEIEVLGSGAPASQCLFGSSCIVAPWNQGSSNGHVSLGGLYAFNTGMNAPAFGVQPTGTFFGTGQGGIFYIEYVNRTGATLGGIVTSETTWFLNDEDRASTARLFFTNAATGAAPRVAVASVTTMQFGSATATWTPTSFAGVVDVTSLNIVDGAPFYIGVQILDAGGSMNRDELAFDDIRISSCGNGVVDGGEQCDAGAANGSTICGCQSTCTWGVAETVCAASSGQSCDAPDTCDGAGTCVDRFQASGTGCRDVAGTCDVAEVCTGTGPACPADTFIAGGTSCRAAADVCDVAESCSGTSAQCPLDGFVAAGTSCRAIIDICDVAEACTGTGASCPADGFVAAGTVCRSMNDVCDLPEACTGVTPSCPFDAFAPTGVVCNPSLGLCDPAELCTGVTTSCPSNVVASAGTLCRMAADLCDVNDTCDGVTVGCTDNIAAAGAPCRVSTGTCDTADSCDGASITCVDTHVANGTSCSDSLSCNGNEQCFGGTCAMGLPVSCDDGDACTTDGCGEPGGTCNHAAIAGCCNPGSSCDDADFCTADSCSGPGGVCDHAAISNCCHSDADCADASACTTDACDTTTHTCGHIGIAGCCTTAADCSDGNACTSDTCGAGGTCSNAAVTGCCQSAGDCGDGNACTTDACTSNACTHAAVSGCCMNATDCDDHNACTTDSCGTTSACSNVTIPGCGDAGMPDGGLDAGMPGTDAGMTPPDAGSAHDAGPRVDGAADGAVGVDAGTTTTTGGCCSVAAGTGNPIGAPLIALGMGLAVLIRRRRRN